MIFKKDNLSFGLILGFIAPLLSLVIYYFVKFYPVFSMGDMFDALKTNKRLVTAISIPCLFLNVILFTIYINSRRDSTAKGIFASTLLYAIASLLFKFLG
ncbi:MAG: hypothetical protein J0H29_03845 [Sphingobacteriales bacterium]|nr:hypothetical protein [Sphingobacteriales bacterium]OJY91146.1 MAG: hypothetical protein BGP14_07130 [Sphingobacteriales bacterium 44-15]